MAGKFIRSTDRNYVEVCGEIRAETEKAWLIGDGVVEVWIPKSQIEEDEPEIDGNLITFTIPEWLAKGKGLL